MQIFMGHMDNRPAASLMHSLQEPYEDGGDYNNDDGDDDDGDDDDGDDDDDDDDNNDGGGGGDDEPIEYLYGDLELKIIDARGMVNHTKFVNYLDKNSKNSVDIAIRLYNETVACSQISHNLDHLLQVSLAHPVETNLEVRFKFMMGSQAYSGVATLPCRDIDAYNEFKRWFPVSCRGFLTAVKQLPHNKDKNKDQQYIEVQLQVKFTPCEENPLYKGGIGTQYAMRKSYFPLRHGGKVTLYQDAHCVTDPNLPKITLGNDKIFKRGTFCEDICHAISNAKQMVYIVGWDISPKVRLLTEPEKRLETLGELLKNKSRQGAEVLLLAWNEYVDIGSSSKAGVQPQPMTHAEEIKLFFEKKEGELAHNVKCKLVHRNQGGELSSAGGKTINLIFSHYQKCVIVDENGKMTAFIGVQDLRSRRYDTTEHQLYHDHNTIFEDDFLNPAFLCKIEGPAVYDVLKNFKQLWQESTKKEIEDHVLNFDNPLVGVFPEDDSESWNVQIFRSIDSRSVKDFSTTSDATEQEALIWEENLVIDRSIQMAYIQAIRSAQHFIYIENQYFIGSLPDQNMGGVNLIPLELALKIASKIRAKDDFRAYVVIPMWPEDDPKFEDSKQRRTMQMMYEIIAEEIKFAELESVHPTDYLNFYCLGKRDIPPHDEVNKNVSSQESLPSRRCMTYEHTKSMIVDDAYLILGSANINQSSMDGSRDTEIAMGVYQPFYTCILEKQHPRGQVYGYRMSLWLEHLKEVVGKKPETLDCVKLVNRVAERNWKKFTDDQFSPLQGHILKYPVEVDGDGKVKPKPMAEIFPDVSDQVLGSKPDNTVLSHEIIHDVGDKVLDSKPNRPLFNVPSMAKNLILSLWRSVRSQNHKQPKPVRGKGKCKRDHKPWRPHRLFCFTS